MEQSVNAHWQSSRSFRILKRFAAFWFCARAVLREQCRVDVSPNATQKAEIVARWSINWARPNTGVASG
jgi:hypothetical protein